MKALFYESPGGPDELRYADVADPTPGPLDVIVRVGATSLNHLDVVQRNGWYTLPGFTLPHIAGMDFAGEIVDIGHEVDGVRVGDRVVVDPSLAEVPAGSKLTGMGDLYGDLGVLGATVAGGYAELCLVPSTHVHSIPDTMSWDTAATFPTAFLTAHHALFDVGQLRRGETIMIHAAGSGVSGAAITLAKHFGAIVLATARGEAKRERALGLGADFAADSTAADVATWAREITSGRGVDMVFDHVGPALWSPSINALAPRGRLVNCGNTTGDAATIHSLGQFFHLGLQIRGSDPYRHEEFRPVWDLFCEQGFALPIDSVFALADGATAQEKMLRNDFFGKIVLRP